jgi:hypothetical protein
MIKHLGHFVQFKGSDDRSILAFERLWLRIRLRSFDRDLVWELKSTTAVRLFHVYVREQLYRTIRHNTKNLVGIACVS